MSRATKVFVLLLALLATQSFLRLLKTLVFSSPSIKESEKEDPVQSWLSENQLDHLWSGLSDLRLCADLDNLPRLSNDIDQERLEAASTSLKNSLILSHWLLINSWTDLAFNLQEVAITSLGQLKSYGGQDDLILAFKQHLPASEDDLVQLEAVLWRQLNENQETNHENEKEVATNGFSPARLFLSLFLAAFFWCIWDVGVTPSEVWHGIPLHKKLTSIEWPRNMEASNTKTVTVTFSSLKGQPVSGDELEEADLSAEVICHSRRVTNVTLTLRPPCVEVIFGSQLSGTYVVNLLSGRHMVRGFPCANTVLSSLVDAEKTTLYNLRSTTLVLTSGSVQDVKLDPRDRFGNAITCLDKLADRFTVRLRRLVDNKSFTDNFVVYRTSMLDGLCISVAFRPGEEGWYEAQILLDKRPIGTPKLSLIVLSRNESAKVDRLVDLAGKGHQQSTDYFEADLVALNGKPQGKSRKVYCYLTTKQLTIKEYFLRIFFRRAFTFRLVPATKLTLVRYHANSPVIRVEDSYQGRPDLHIREGNIMAACYHQLLLRKIGGSETFMDKQTFFNKELINHHHSKGHRHSAHSITVERWCLIESTYRATRWFSDSDWAKLFVVEFTGEQGIDQGGLRREWFDLVAKQLFHPVNKLFVQVEEGSSEAVIPNPHYGHHNIKLNRYKFAGRLVGKCLYESAHGVTYRCHLPARLAKSFLAQLVGLRVHYRHFEDDAPEFYTSKIRLIESQNVEDPQNGLDDLTFVEEEHLPGGGVKHVELKHGRQEKVVEGNKYEYLDSLAQYKLCTRLKEQVEAFLEGLHTFVPDSLLSLLDESELELLLCGVREYSVEELKMNHVVVTVGLSHMTLDWFWLALANMTGEQMARLLQFTTGSSQLPPGGFAELKPKFQVASSFSRDNLPTAHTCFNMICLPEHNTFAEFEKALLLAITEGSEGFGLA